MADRPKISVIATLDESASTLNIEKSLDNIKRNINENPPKIIICLNEAQTKKRIKQQLSRALDDLGLNNTHNVKIGVKLGGARLFKKIHQDIRQESDETTKRLSQNNDEANRDEIQRQLTIKETARYLKEIANLEKAAANTRHNVSKEYFSEKQINQIERAEEAVKRLTAARDAMQQAMAKSSPNDKKVTATFHTKQEKDRTILTAEKQLQNFDASLKELKYTVPSVTKSLNAMYQAQKAVNKGFSSADLLEYNKLGNKMTTYYNSLAGQLEKFPELSNQFNDLFKKINMGTILPNDAKAEWANLQMQIRAAGLEVDTFGDKLIRTGGARIRALFSGALLFGAINGFRTLIDNVRELDAAMTELRKVTNNTGSEYAAFLNNAAKDAQSVGATLVDMVKTSSDFARLGYSLNEVPQLARAATMYKNVGDDIGSIDDATKSLISTMQGYKIPVQGVSSIVDKFNEVANHFPTSAGAIGEGLKRSAAALSAAGNDLDQSIALFTAGMATVQNEDVVGTALKTMSMRLRTSKTDMEKFGEETDGMATSVSKLRGEIKALSGVDIMIDNKNFKSTYDILNEISKVWDKISDVGRANILELFFGKRQANVGTAIIANNKLMQESYETAKNSAGSALAENEKYLDSINGKIAKLSAVLEDLSRNTMESGVIKGVVDTITLLAKGINWVMSGWTKWPAIIGLTTLAFLKFTKVGRDLIATNDELVRSGQSVIASYQRMKEIRISGDDIVAKDAYNKAHEQGVFNAAPENYTKEQQKAFSTYKASLESASPTFQKLAASCRAAGISIDTVAASAIKGDTALKIQDGTVRKLVNTYKEGSVAAKLFSVGLNNVEAGSKRYASAGVQAGEAASKTAQSFSFIQRAAGRTQMSFGKVAMGAADVANKVPLLSGALGELGSSFLSMAKGTLVAMAVSLAIEGIVKLVDALVVTNAEFEEQLKSSTDALKNTKGEITNTETELKTLNERIKEIKSQGVLTFTDEAELGKLERQRAELELTLKVLEAKKKIQQQKVNDETEEYFQRKNSEVKHVYAARPRNVDELDTIQSKKLNAAADYFDVLIDKSQKCSKEINNLIAESETATGGAAQTVADKLEKAHVTQNDLINTLTDARDKLLAEDSSLLDSKGQEVYAQRLNKINKALYNLGAINLNDILKLNPDTRGIDNFEQSLAKWAKSAKEITPESVKEAFPQVISILKEYGFTLDEITEKAKQYNAETIKPPEIETPNIQENLQNLNDFSGFVGNLNNAFKELEETGYVSAGTFEAISEAFQKITDNADPSVLEDYINVLSDSSSTTEEITAATERLVAEVLNHGAALEGLTEQQKNLYISELERLGIANARILVELELADATYSSADATKAAKQASANHIQELLTETGALDGTTFATLSGADALELYHVMKMNVGSSNFASVIISHANAFIEVAKRAGSAAATLQQYATIAAQIGANIKRIGEIGTSIRTLSHIKSGVPVLDKQIDNQISKLTREMRAIEQENYYKNQQLKKIQTQAYQEFVSAVQNPFRQAIYRPSGAASYRGRGAGSSGRSGGGSSRGGSGGSRPSYSRPSSSRSSAAAREEDPYRIAKSDLDHKLRMNEMSYKDYYNALAAIGDKYLKNNSKKADEYKKHLEELASVRKRAFDFYRDNDLNDKLESGQISIENYYNTIKSLIAQWLGSTANKIDYKDAGKKLADQINDYFKKQISAINDKLEDLDLLKESTPGVTAAAHWKGMIRDIQKAYNDGILNAKAYSELYHDVFKKLVAAEKEAYHYYIEDRYDKELEAGKISIEQYQHMVKSLMKDWLGTKAHTNDYLDASEKLANKILDYFKKEISKVSDNISMLDWEKMWAPGEQAADHWADMLEKIKMAYAQGVLNAKQYSELYHDVLEKLIKSQENFNKTQKKGVDDLVSLTSDMLKKNIEQLINKYKEIVDQKKKSLELTKREEEYTESIADKTKDIAKLQAKVQMLSLDNSRAGKARYQAALDELQTLKKDLSKTQKDHAYDKTIEALDKNAEEYEKRLSKDLNHNGKWLEYVYNYMKATKADTLLKQLTDYNYEFGSGINSTVTDMWTTTYPILKEYNFNIAKIVKILNDRESLANEDNKSAHYMTKDQLAEMASPAVTKNQSHSKNLDLTDEMRRHYGEDAWYDPSSKIWYASSGKNITAEAAPLLSRIAYILSTRYGALGDKDVALLNPLLLQLRKMNGYADAWIDYSKKLVWKTKGENIRVFHRGLAEGFIDRKYASLKQFETYALLMKDELVLNKDDQMKLRNKLQNLDMYKGLVDQFKTMITSGVTNGSNAVKRSYHTHNGAINITVEAPINISGSADMNTIKQLESFGDKLANQTLSKLNSALKQRGYKRSVSSVVVN